MIARWAYVTWMAALAGCSSGSSNASGGKDAGAADTGASSDAASADAAQAGPAYFGKVQFAREDQGSILYSAQVVFARTGALASAFDCPAEGTQTGACCYVPPPDAGSSAIASQSAGTVTLSDDGASFATLAYDPSKSSTGYVPFSAHPPTASWKAGDTMQVAAQGATVQGFDGTIALPPALQGLSVSSSPPPHVSLTADWTITWTAGAGSAKVQLYLSSGGTIIKCTVSDAAGTLTVPAALMAHVQPNAQNEVRIGSVASTTVDAPNAKVEITAFDEIATVPAYQ